MALNEFGHFLLDQLEQHLGTCTTKRMFGGHALYHNQACFGLMFQDSIYIKADDLTRDQFAGLEQFSYEAKGKTIMVSNYALTETIIENTEELARLCQLGVEAALRAKAKKRPKKKIN